MIAYSSNSPIIVPKRSARFKNYVARAVVNRSISGRKVMSLYPDISQRTLQKWCESYRLYAGVLT